VAETSGLLNRRTGNSRTEGSNPSVSASEFSFFLECLGELRRQRAGSSIGGAPHPFCLQERGNFMQYDINTAIDRQPLGKGVFKPSRAPIAREMKARLELGSSVAKQRHQQPTGSRH
jgi:hypothetical protein